MSSRSLLIKRKDANDTPSAIWWVPIDGRVPHRIDLGSNGEPLTMSVNPDGKHVAFAIRDLTPFKPYEIWALENFLPAR